MSRFSRCAALAVFTAVITSSGAYAASEHHHAALAGAHNGPSEEDTRKQCLEEARSTDDLAERELRHAGQPPCRRTELHVRQRPAISVTERRAQGDHVALARPQEVWITASACPS